MDIKLHDIPQGIVLAAMEWYFQFDEDCSRDEAQPLERWEQFQVWLKADPMHQAAYKHIQNAGDYLAARGYERGLRGPPREPS
jgi:ferric-dicitrate binding protein FerR (iron transport regulator)